LLAETNTTALVPSLPDACGLVSVDDSKALYCALDSHGSRDSTFEGDVPLDPPQHTDSFKGLADTAAVFADAVTTDASQMASIADVLLAESTTTAQPFNGDVAGGLVGASLSKSQSINGPSAPGAQSEIAKHSSSPVGLYELRCLHLH